MAACPGLSGWRDYAPTVICQRQGRNLLLVSLLVLAACSSSDDGPDASSSEALSLPTDVPAADDLFVGTDDGLMPTQSTVPASVPAVDLPPDERNPVESLPEAGPDSTLAEPANVDTADQTADPDDPPASTGAPVPGEPLVTTIPATVPIEPPPAGVVPRVVSMSGSHTDMLFAMGAGDLVVAVALENNSVAEAAPLEDLALELQTSLLGELAAAYDPTLVIVGTDEPGALAAIGASALPLYAGEPAATLAEIYRQITDLGDLVDRTADAAALVERMQADVAEIIADLGPLVDAGLTFFHEVDPTLVTFDDSSFLVGLLAELGLTNVFTTSGDVGFPQMTADEVIAADPDVITLGDVDCCNVTIDLLRARSGWDQITAVQNGSVAPLTTAQFSEWGPGVVDVLRLVAAAMASS